jgi:hypothetical protein
MPKPPPLCCLIVSDDGKLYIEYDGRRIATRGPRARQWTMLEPGYVVRGMEAGTKRRFLDVEFHGTKVH